MSAILVLNAGSSSHKSCLYSLSDLTNAAQPCRPLWEAQIDWLIPPGQLHVTTAQGVDMHKDLAALTRPQALALMWATLLETHTVSSLTEILGLGHRIVHGGTQFASPVVINPAVKKAIRDLIPLAPLHNPLNLEGIEIGAQIFGETMPQVAIFDTAFHRTLPQVAQTYPGLYEWIAKDILRYGFHGISHEYCSQRVSHLIGSSHDSGKIINCHLGNGCSLAAIQGGRSLNTTMGFTPLDGLMMGTRAGSLDPGIVLHLLQSESASQIQDLLEHQAGLKGISGLSADIRPIRAAADQGNLQAQLALDLFVHSVQMGIGQMLASLQGLDVLIFTAGIGENDSQIRWQVCAAFGFLGLILDEAKNNQPSFSEDTLISAAQSQIQVWVIHTQENWLIAQATRQILEPSL